MGIVVSEAKSRWGSNADDVPKRSAAGVIEGHGLLIEIVKKIDEGAGN